MLPENIIYLAIPVTLIAYFYYSKNTLSGQTRPNLVSWFFWMLIPFIGVYFQLKAGANLSVIPLAIDGVSSLLVIVVALWNKNSYWEITTPDIICGALATLAIVFYLLTHNLGISIIFAIAGDTFASVPTLIKSWKFPETETAVAYLATVFSNILGLLVIKNWIFTIYSFGLYLAIINLAIVFCIYRKKIFKNI
jgi:hypothetical protein